jgi:hypothetical protein
MAGPSLYPILLNRGATQPPDLYPLFMERDDLIPQFTRVSLVFEADGFPPCPIVPIVDTDIIQDRGELLFDTATEPQPDSSVTSIVDTGVVQDRSSLLFDTSSEPQPDQTVRSKRDVTRTSERAVFRVKSRRRSHTV